ncbi:MAG: hypothetical protein V1893_03270 [Candidatus Omnitrophota bacterium]
MGCARKVKQIVVITPNKVGMLAEISSIIAVNGINIIALCAYGLIDKANFMIITEDNQRAIAALKAKNYEVVKEEDVGVLSIPNKPGETKRIAEKLATSNINLEYCYNTTGDSKDSLFVFATNHLDMALEILNK